jgi:integrase
MQLNINITKRVRRRRYPNGVIVRLTRYVANYRDPKTGQRRQEFFERAKDAQDRRAELQGMVAAGSYVDARAAPTVAEAVQHWLGDRAGKVRAHAISARHTPRPAGRRKACRCWRCSASSG